jgi:hypothetical protein
LDSGWSINHEINGQPQERLCVALVNGRHELAQFAARGEQSAHVMRVFVVEVVMECGCRKAVCWNRLDV